MNYLDIISNLNIEIFSDGADLDEMSEMYNKRFIKGLTTNPTLMKQSGIKNYKEFCLKVLEFVKDKPISFEVFADDFETMINQAKIINSWGENVFIKIPITNTKGEITAPVVEELSNAGIKLNITAITNKAQFDSILPFIKSNVQNYLSIFAGRIADTGVDPVPIVGDCVNKIQDKKNFKIIWASPREILNIFQANSVGCDVITVTGGILNKLKFIGYDLDKYSLDTVNMFYDDALKSGYKI